MKKRLTTGERRQVSAQLNRDVRVIYSTDLTARTAEARHEGRKELYYSNGQLKVLVDGKVRSQAQPMEREAHSNTSLIHQRGKHKNNGIYRQDAIIAAFSYVAYKDERSTNRRAERAAKRAERKERREFARFVKGEVLSYVE